MSQKIRIRENGVVRKVSVGEAMVARLFERAMNGTMRDMLAFMKEAGRLAPELVEDQSIPQTITIEFVEAGETYTQEEFETKVAAENI